VSRTELFLASLSEEARATFATWTGTEHTLEVLLDQAHAAWPDLEVSEARFVRHIAASLDGGAASTDGLRSLHAADLYFACACADGDPRALAAFEQRYWAHVTAALARIGVLAAAHDDIVQELRTALFVANDAPGTIAGYRGRGDLRGWLRASALRAGYRAARRPRREMALDDDATR